MAICPVSLLTPYIPAKLGKEAGFLGWDKQFHMSFLVLLCYIFSWQEPGSESKIPLNSILIYKMLEPGKGQSPNYMREDQELLSVSCADRQKSSYFRIQRVPISLVRRSGNPPVSEPLWDPNHLVAEINSHWSDLKFLLTVPLSTTHLLTDSFPFRLVPLSSNASACREWHLSVISGRSMHDSLYI